MDLRHDGTTRKAFPLIALLLFSRSLGSPSKLTSLSRNSGNSAVHCSHTTAKGILKTILAVKRFCKILQDSDREEQFNKLSHQFEGMIRAFALDKIP
jgi:hypothetical protein